MELRRIDVLRVADADDGMPEKLFRKGEVVRVIARDGFEDVELVGRLHVIDTLEITLDCSKEYENNVVKINFRDISKIEWV